ncbi:MAG: hypothetical protein M1838_005233 [Thelocarpon superellum]|nr:MAG: hypothetical protein M1838_005233 [Thelocarpon superellum]
MAMPEHAEEDSYLGQALPSPTNTPYRTPSRSRSRRSSTYDASDLGPSSSPPPLPPDQNWSQAKDTANQDMSAIDPRRFTPTLHANLVAEILSLRRDLDSKNGFIDGLESNLHTARAEYDALNTTFSANAKEARSLRRQLQLLEGGTSSALNELARERDEAVDQAVETKRRLEISQKKVRTQEDDAMQAHEGWEKDKQQWDAERRNLQRKVHVVEGRLKAILEEVAIQQAAANAHTRAHDSGAESDADDAKENGGGAGSDTASVRSLRGVRPMSAMSVDETRNVRLSTLSGLNGLGAIKANGRSLADELNMDEEDEEHETEGTETPAPDADPTIPVPEGLEAKPDPGGSMEKELPTPLPKVEYVERGTQPSPPPSPTMPSRLGQQIKPDVVEDRAPSPTSQEANQRRKRMAAQRPVSPVPTRPVSIVVPSPLTVSSACQTIDGPLSPPKTPISPLDDKPPPPTTTVPPIETLSVATQTDLVELRKAVRTPTPPPMVVPSIAIHPPTSAPSSPGKSVLPPQTKSVGCQASIPVSAVAKSKSTGMQTEEIRIDKRSVTLPANLLPSAISSSPPGPDRAPVRAPSKEMLKRGAKKSVKKPVKAKKAPPEPTSPPPAPPRDAYPGHNDDGVLRSGKTNKIRRPFRTSSLFTGFDLPSSDDADEFVSAEEPENDFGTALTAPKPRAAAPARLNASAVLPGPAIPELDSDEEVDPGWAHIFTSRSSATSSVTAGETSKPKPVAPLGARKASDKLMKVRHGESPLQSNPVKVPNFRKSALISSGAAAHTQRARSPSLDDIREGKSTRTQPTPPFPVPTRSSSRRIPVSSSEGARSPTRQSSSSHRKRTVVAMPPKKENLRKVRSAAAIARHSRRDRPRSRSPPALSTSSMAPDSPRLPPLPQHEVTTPQHAHDHQRRDHHHHQPSNMSSINGSASLHSSVTPTNVVDAISQTMVGEWMWKYVRKRTSFGIPESPQGGPDTGKPGDDGAVNVTGSGVRHKRWVWLAPYERAVMWSSRQPTSGSALLGKSGRKLTIQSVLDVKDDTPMPKSTASQPLFNRSILILTPARALKFTATSKERHYIWLTALSFLSHSSDSASEIFHMPPPPLQEYEAPPRQASGSLRRNTIRDSIRVAKGKSRPELNGNVPRPAHSGGGSQQSIQELGASVGSFDAMALAADPPIVPRFTSHNRRRSNTGPRAPPPSSFRSFTNHVPAPSSTHSFVTNGSSEAYGNGSSVGGLGFHSGQSSLSRGTSEVGGLSTQNFFDAVGTVRMEAFVRRTPFMDFDSSGPSVPGRRGDGSHKREKAAWNGGTDLDGERIAQHDHFVSGEDPFRGF